MSDYPYVMIKNIIQIVGQSTILFMNSLKLSQYSEYYSDNCSALAPSRLK